MHQISRETAIDMAKAETWRHMTPEGIARFQLYQQYLAVPFDKFQSGMELLLGRGVWTHEFADQKALQAELEARDAARGK